jgi:hypothetical protein
MNSSIFINDFRRRSIRVERDKILEQLRMEEEMENMSIPKRFIFEAEERARERVEGQRWKRILLLVLFFGIGGFIIFKVFRRASRIPRATRVEMEVQTETKKTVSFREDRRDLLRGEYPDSWETFVEHHSPEWLVSDITGGMQFDFYNEDENVAVDIVPGDFYKFPNSVTNDEIRFQNMIYDKKLKRQLCEEYGVDYVELTLT